MWHTAYWPWPPHCLTCRPWTVAAADERLPQRHPQGLGLDLDAVAVAQPPEQHVDVGLAHGPQHDLVGLRRCARCRIVGSSADEPLQRARRACPRRLGGGGDRHGQQRLRQHPRLDQRPGVLGATACRRSRRCVSLATTHEVAGDGRGLVETGLVERGGERPDALVVVVAGMPLAGRRARRRRSRCPETCTTVSGRSVPRTRARATAGRHRGRLVVRMTSATSGPSGSQVSSRQGVADRVSWRSAAGAAPAAGRRARCRWSSSSRPDAGLGGDRDHRVEAAVATAVSRSVDDVRGRSPRRSR